jgi:hypothetical protein
MGLRELADSIALSRPGVTATHALGDDRDGTQLAQLLRLVYSQAADDVGPMPAVTCWVHPRFVEYPPDQQTSFLVAPDGRSTLLQPAVKEVLAGDDTPAWVASGTRYLEHLQSLWAPQSPDAPPDSDAVAALGSVADLLEEHAQRVLADRGRP